MSQNFSVNPEERWTYLIRLLNDAFRTSLTGGKVVLTPRVQGLSSSDREAFVEAVRRFSAFSEGDDPYGRSGPGSRASIASRIACPQACGETASAIWLPLAPVGFFAFLLRQVGQIIGWRKESARMRQEVRTGGRSERSVELRIRWLKQTSGMALAAILVGSSPFGLTCLFFLWNAIQITPE